VLKSQQKRRVTPNTINFEDSLLATSGVSQAQKNQRSPASLQSSVEYSELKNEP
jgi:hypothetical protein